MFNIHKLLRRAASVILVGAALVSVTPNALIAQGWRFPGVTLPDGRCPGSVVLGDFDGDHDQDFVTGHCNDESLSVHLNHGDGTFTKSPVIYNTQAYVRSLVTADFDGDSDLDLAFVNRSTSQHAVWIMLNNGDGTFITRMTLQAGVLPYDLAVGDLDGDSFPDLVVANVNDDTVSVYRNRRDGTFDTQINYSTNDGPIAIKTGDFDGDNDIDIVTANFFSGDVTILGNNSDGTFAEGIHVQVASACRKLAVGDIDHDSDLDVVVVNDAAPRNLFLLQNDGLGNFTSNIAFPLAHEPGAVEVGDLDHDEDLDVLVSNVDDNSVWILLNDGGTFVNTAQYVVGFDPVAIKIGQLNNDSEVDLLVANEFSIYTKGDVSVLFGDGNGEFLTESKFDAGVKPKPLVIADFDGDQDLDLATGSNTYDGFLSILLNDGDGAYAPPVTYDVAANQPYVLAAGDLDGDLDLDLVSGNFGSSDISIYLNNGDGTIVESLSLPLGVRPSCVFVADLNGDQNSDIVSCAATGVSVFLNRGQMSFDPRVDYSVDPSLFSMTVADFDGDSDIDLAIVKSRKPYVSFFFNNGDGSFAEPEQFMAGDRPVFLTAGDVDGDSDCDLVLINTYRPYFSVLLNDGDGGFGFEQRYDAASLSPKSVVLSDMDGDADLDIVALSSGMVSLLANLGDGTFENSGNYRNSDSGQQTIVVGDIDRDSDLDLVVSVETENSVSVLYNSYIPAVDVFATSLEVTKGDLIAGGTEQLSVSDNDDLNIRRSNAAIESQTEFQLKSVSPVPSPNTFEVVLEGSVFSRSEVRQTIELYDYDLNQWELVDSRVANRFVDLTTRVAPAGDLSRFVEQETRCIMTRIQYTSVNRRQQFSSLTDYFSWEIQ